MELWQFKVESGVGLMLKGRIVVMVKKWWVLALVFTLALSLTSCSSKKRNLNAGNPNGFGYCDGTLGSFDIYVVASPSNAGLYELSVIPVSLDAPGDIVRVAVANNSLAYKEMVTQVVVNPQQEIFAGYLTVSDLQNYDILAITPYEPGVSFLEGTAEKDAICSVPLPGDDGTQQPVQ